MLTCEHEGREKELLQNADVTAVTCSLSQTPAVNLNGGRIDACVNCLRFRV